MEDAPAFDSVKYLNLLLRWDKNKEDRIKYIVDLAKGRTHEEKELLNYAMELVIDEFYSLGTLSETELLNRTMEEFAEMRARIRKAETNSVQNKKKRAANQKAALAKTQSNPPKIPDTKKRVAKKKKLLEGPSTGPKLSTSSSGQNTPPPKTHSSNSSIETSANTSDLLDTKSLGTPVTPETIHHPTVHKRRHRRKKWANIVPFKKQSNVRWQNKKHKCLEKIKATHFSQSQVPAYRDPNTEARGKSRKRSKRRRRLIQTCKLTRTKINNLVRPSRYRWFF